MPLLFACPTTEPRVLVPKIEESTPRLDGIMSALRGECLQVVSTVYREIPTRETPVLTDLLHAFQGGDREELSDLRLDFPDIPEECFEASPETNIIAGPGEVVDTYDHRIQTAMNLARKLGPNVLIVAPVQVIKHLTGATLDPGEVYAYSDEASYHAQCDLELSKWRQSTSS